MSINVKLGKAKTQTGKPFPKLMIHQGINGYVIIFATAQKGIALTGTCLKSVGFNKDVVGEFSSEWSAKLYHDYNEPITIQNT